tara:strand:- start:13 stop:336 length:324 start_codon:yes stop_codon:yes gene_type:complete
MNQFVLKIQNLSLSCCLLSLTRHFRRVTVGFSSELGHLAEKIDSYDFPLPKIAHRHPYARDSEVRKDSYHCDNRDPGLFELSSFSNSRDDIHAKVQLSAANLKPIFH